MATPSSVLAWRSPRTEEPGRLQSMGFCRVRHDCSDLACRHPLLYLFQFDSFMYKKVSRGKSEGWTGSMGLVDANYNI